MAVILESTSFFGLDLGETNIRVIQLNHSSDPPSLIAAGSIEAPSNPYVSENKDDQQAVVAKLRQLLEEVGIITENVSFSLPEREVFTRVIELPHMPKDDIEQALRYEAESYIPYPLDEVQVDWQLIDEAQLTEAEGKSGNIHALLVATPLKTIDSLVNTLELAGLKPLIAETNNIANNRALTNEAAESPCFLIADCGATATELCISDRGMLRLTHNVPIGGAHLTQAIRKELGIKDAEAEKLKLNTDKLDFAQQEIVTKALQGTIEAIIAEMKRSIDFYQGKGQATKISKIVLTGRGAHLKLLRDIVGSHFNLPTEVGTPWAFITSQTSLTKEQLAQMAPAFAVAIGLALRRKI
jgi:type IV pilus assembly protein PilM